MAALWLLGVSVVLLTVDVHCMPVENGPSPVTTPGWGDNAAPGLYNLAPEAGVRDLAFANSEPPQGSPGYNVPSGVESAPSSSSISVLSGNFPAVAPPSPSSVGEAASLGPIMPRPYFPPRPEYQAGQLSHVERSHEFGDRQTEREESSQSAPPPPPVLPMAQGASPALTSVPRPEPWLGGGWDFYPYYEYRFLTGQYPPGTLTYSSNSFEHGRNYLHDVRYRRPPPMPYVYPQPRQAVGVPLLSQEQSLRPVPYW